MQTANLFEIKRFSNEKYQKVGVFDSGRMFCDVYCFLPGQDQSIHKHHDSDKVYYVLEGKGKFRVNETEKELKAGEAVLAPASSDHGVENNSDSNLVLLVFMAPKPKH